MYCCSVQGIHQSCSWRTLTKLAALVLPRTPAGHLTAGVQLDTVDSFPDGVRGWQLLTLPHALSLSLSLSHPLSVFFVCVCVCLEFQGNRGPDVRALIQYFWYTRIPNVFRLRHPGTETEKGREGATPETCSGSWSRALRRLAGGGR